jgi:hypothetical protein
MEKAALPASLAAAGGSLHRPGASRWLRGDERSWRDVSHADSEVHYFDGDRNCNFRNATGNGDNHAHGQLGVSRHPVDDALRLREFEHLLLVGNEAAEESQIPLSGFGSQIDFVGMGRKLLLVKSTSSRHGKI